MCFFPIFVFVRITFSPLRFVGVFNEIHKKENRKKASFFLPAMLAVLPKYYYTTNTSYLALEMFTNDM